MEYSVPPLGVCFKVHPAVENGRSKLKALNDKLDRERDFYTIKLGLPYISKESISGMVVQVMKFPAIGSEKMFNWPPNTIKSEPVMSKKCPDCIDGKVALFSSVCTCEKCNGKGTIQDQTDDGGSG
jgi:hypothetical protein